MVAAILTPVQRRLYLFIYGQQQTPGVTPSTREMAEYLGCTQNNILQLLRAMTRNGFIERPPRKKRMIKLLKLSSVLSHECAKTMTIPVFGQIPAGLPAEAYLESDEYVVVDATKLFLKGSGTTFGLRVKGDSMKNANIIEDDLIILQVRQAMTGEVVAALVDGETTLKRLALDGPSPSLHAENPAYAEVIPLQELQIQGVMAGLIRTGSR